MTNRADSFGKANDLDTWPTLPRFGATRAALRRETPLSNEKHGLPEGQPDHQQQDDGEHRRDK